MQRPLLVATSIRPIRRNTAQNLQTATGEMWLGFRTRESGSYPVKQMTLAHQNRFLAAPPLALEGRGRICPASRWRGLAKTMNEQTTKPDPQINTLETIIENYIRVAEPLVFTDFVPDCTNSYYQAYFTLLFPELGGRDRECLVDMAESRADVFKEMDRLKASTDAAERADHEHYIQASGKAYFDAKAELLKRNITARMTPYQLQWLERELFTIPLLERWFRTPNAPPKQKKSAVTKV